MQLFTDFRIRHFASQADPIDTLLRLADEGPCRMLRVWRLEGADRKNTARTCEPHFTHKYP
jgi:hypothetical protein